MMGSKNWERSKYYGMTRPQIKQAWQVKRVSASQQGTALHKDIEKFYNGMEVTNTSSEYQFFLKFQRDLVETAGLQPYRTEWEIFDEELELAGSIDMIYQADPSDPDTLVMYDWKRCGDIKMDNRFETGFPPLQHLPNCNFWTYSLQLNTYKAILERKYGKKIKEMNLLWLHPDNDSYRKVKVPHMESEIEEIFAQRQLEVSSRKRKRSTEGIG